MPEQTETGRRSFGLFVGVGQRDGDSEHMQISASDAEYMHLAFLHYGKLDSGQRLLRNEATHNNILGELDNLARETDDTPADLVVIYFSGHGYKLKNEYYLICHDTAGNNIERSAINGNVFLQKLQAIRCEKMLVLLDCCHAGGVGNPEDIPFDPSSFRNKPNHVVLTACHGSQVSYLSNPVSIFTYALIEGLGGWYFLEGDRYVQLFDLAMYVRERVVWLSENNLQIRQSGIQKPQLYVLPESKTENFTILQHHRGKPLKKFFKVELETVKDTGGKMLNVEEGVINDHGFREQFRWIKLENNITQFGHTNTAFQNAPGGSQIIYQTFNYGTHLPAAAQTGTIRGEEPKAGRDKETRKREFPKKHADKCTASKKPRPFFITFNGNQDIKLNYVEWNEMRELTADESINDLLCSNTINYCYETVRGSGENLRTDTRKNLSTLIGSYLFKILLKNKEGDALIHSFEENEKREKNEKEDIQLVLNFKDNKEADKLSYWPWEYLYYSNEVKKWNDYFLLSKIKINRLYKEPGQTDGNNRTAGKLKVLVFFAPLKDYQDRHITDIKNLFEDISDEYGDIKDIETNNIKETGNFEYRILHSPKHAEKGDLQVSYINFFRTIDEFKPNVIHFVGESQSDDQEQKLFFKKREANRDVPESIALADEFYPFINRYFDANPNLKLFIFQSWSNEADNAYKTFKRIADQLLEMGVPVVMSIPSAFHKEGTDCFKEYLEPIREFYEMLAEECVAGTAIFEFRKKLIDARKGYPIVYLNNVNSDNFSFLAPDPSGKLKELHRTQSPKDASSDLSRSAGRVGTGSFDDIISAPRIPDTNIQPAGSQGNQLDVRSKRNTQ
ncbi:MAG: caspase family protein [Chitinophagaceae bacterium]|nr:caspase family protein [Chitinophagaceae bacterium]MCW5926440.1 caspase family protein [Chitinophagaceae bacterium]